MNLDLYSFGFLPRPNIPSQHSKSSCDIWWTAGTLEPFLSLRRIIRRGSQLIEIGEGFAIQGHARQYRIVQGELHCVGIGGVKIELSSEFRF